ncbi:MAG: hypothetical protein Q4Q18_06240 [Methanobrevibacter sp.]|nr:hypothetical protein [Methanobrevibacter sp.]
MNSKNEFLDKTYKQYNDYNFKSILRQRANGLLKFIGIPYEIENVLSSEYTNLGPSISRLDFVGEVIKDGEIIILILECQTKLPNEDDIKRFFQYVSSLRIFKNNHFELYILCTQKVPYTKKDFVINDECTYVMHMISLKDYRAKDIFKNIEDKLKNKEEITDEDIASLQVIVYTDYEESELEILIKARRLIEEIAICSKMDLNEKRAITYLLDVLGTNMLDDGEHEKYVEVNEMLLNPVERYMENKGRQAGLQAGMEEGIKEGKLEVARSLLKEGFDIEMVVRITGLSKEDILNAK